MSKTKTKAKQRRIAQKAKKPKTTWGDVEKASKKTEEKAAAAKKSAKPKNPPPQPTFTKTLKVKITDKERADRALQGAEASKDRDALKVKRKEGMDWHRVRIQMKDEEVAKCNDAVLTGEEDRDVLCTNQPDYRLGVMRTVRKDTGEEVDEPRPLRVDERQETLDLPEPPKRPKKPDPKDEPEETDITEPQTVLDAEQDHVPFSDDVPEGVEESLG
jgi:hypothetical protein